MYTRKYSPSFYFRPFHLVVSWQIWYLNSYVSNYLSSNLCLGELKMGLNCLQVKRAQKKCDNIITSIFKSHMVIYCISFLQKIKHFLIWFLKLKCTLFHHTNFQISKIFHSFFIRNFAHNVQFSASTKTLHLKLTGSCLHLLGQVQQGEI